MNENFSKPPPEKPLHDMKFVIVGFDKEKKKEIQDAIKLYGGKVGTTVDANVIAIISSPGFISFQQFFC